MFGEWFCVFITLYTQSLYRFPSILKQLGLYLFLPNSSQKFYEGGACGSIVCCAWILPTDRSSAALSILSKENLGVGLLGKHLRSVVSLATT